MLASTSSISSTDASGTAEFRTATAPAKWGAAMEVPSLEANPPPGTAELMLVPGARVLSQDAVLEKLATPSEPVTAPTLMALEMQAGEEMALG